MSTSAMRTLATRHALPVGLLLLAACTEQFEPGWKVDDLHLLALQAEPPEIAPAALPGEPDAPVPDRARLTSLVAHPDHVAGAERRSTVLYFACTPIPGDPSASACSSFDALADPSGFGGEATPDCGAGGPGGAATELGTGVPGGISFSGIEECDHTGCRAARLRLDPSNPSVVIPLPAPEYVLPSALRFDHLQAGAPERATGVQVTVLALVLDAAPEELFAGATDLCTAMAGFGERLKTLMAERKNVTATKRITVRGPECADEPNRNPELPGVAWKDAELSAAGAEGPTEVKAGEALDLLPALPRDSTGQALAQEAFLQPYTERDSAGVVLGEAREQWVYSWYVTGGELERDRTKKLDKVQLWTAPGGEGGDPVPANGRVRLYVVVRDLRGGIAWTAREVIVR